MEEWGRKQKNKEGDRGEEEKVEEENGRRVEELFLVKLLHEAIRT